jgi:hypothetical protein
LFGVLIGVLGVAVAGAAPAPIPVRIVGVVCIPLAWVYIRRGRRIGVEVGRGGAVVYGPFSTQWVSRDDVLDVGTHRWFMNTVIHLDLRDGRRVETNLIQGALVTWPDGKTTDIRSVLKRELNACVAPRETAQLQPYASSQTASPKPPSGDVSGEP